ncbi:MAG: cupin domain-containing protein [Candidatus Cloacimonetes bacterium]|nr:cupin domain-containing protein [Candidatus Cloacimonadota bacterium]
MNNLFSTANLNPANEIVDILLESTNIRIEKIVSCGQASPPGFMYDQDENEWVIVIKGSAIVSFEDGKKHKLNPGNYLNITAHQKHRVDWTLPDQETLWLAVFYK